MSDRPRGTVYVPRADSRLGIDRGSGIVSIGRLVQSGQATDRVLVDYEGNRYGAVNIVTYADRVAHAYDRQRQQYPTVARALVARESLIEIGWYEPDVGSVVVFPGGARDDLAEWLDAVGTEWMDEELSTSSPWRVRGR